MTNNTNNSDNRGFAAMSKAKVKQAAHNGGKSQGKDNNPANFANDRQKAQRAGQEGGSK